MGTDGERDPLSRIAAKIKECEYDSALHALRQLNRSALAADQQGQALAMGVVCLDRKGQARSANRLLRRSLKARRGDPFFLLASGIQLSELGQLDFAEEVLRHLVSLLPDDHIPQYNLGVVLERRERFAEGLAAYDRAIKLRPDFAPSFRQKAVCWEKKGRREEAAAAYRRYLELQPDDDHTWVSLAIVESDRGDYEGAIRAYHRAYEVNPHSVTLHFNWAITASRQGDSAALAACVTRLEEIAPEDWRTEAAAAYLAEAKGEIWKGWEAACRALERACAAKEEEALEIVAAQTLWYAKQHSLEGHVAGCVPLIFEREVFSERVLAALRALSARRSPRAYDFQVMIEGDVTDQAFSAAATLQKSRSRRWRYLRNYRVWAEDDQEGGRIALEFETRCGETGLRAYEVERVSGPSEEDLGVWWRLGARVMCEVKEKGLLSRIGRIFGS